VRLEWKSNLHGVARCPAECKILGEGEPAGTFKAYMPVISTPDRPDFFGASDITELGAFTLQEKGSRPSFGRTSGPSHPSAHQGAALPGRRRHQRPVRRSIYTG
jgi:hypothetical protein